jgi:hypothetical protein
VQEQPVLRFSVPEKLETLSVSHDVRRRRRRQICNCALLMCALHCEFLITRDTTLLGSLLCSWCAVRQALLVAGASLTEPSLSSGSRIRQPDS